MNFGTGYWDEEPNCGTVTDAVFRAQALSFVFHIRYPIGVEFYVKDGYKQLA